MLDGPRSPRPRKRPKRGFWAAVPLMAPAAALVLAACGGSGGTVTTSSAAEAGKQVFIDSGCGSCHTFAAAGTTGTAGPDLNEYLAPDDNAAGVEEMIVDPEAEIAEGYAGGIMPHTYGDSIPKAELEQLIQFLVNNSPAGGAEEEGPGGEEEDVGGPTK